MKKLMIISHPEAAYQWPHYAKSNETFDYFLAQRVDFVPMWNPFSLSYFYNPKVAKFQYRLKNNWHCRYDILQQKIYESPF